MLKTRDIILDSRSNAPSADMVNIIARVWREVDDVFPLLYVV